MLACVGGSRVKELKVPGAWGMSVMEVMPIRIETYVTVTLDTFSLGFHSGGKLLGRIQRELPPCSILQDGEGLVGYIRGTQ